MNDKYYRLLFFVILYTLQFGTVYLISRKAHPKKALQYSLAAWVFLSAISFYSGALGAMLSFVLMILLIVLLKKPIGSDPAMQKFFADNKIYTATNAPAPVLQKLGNKNWRYAEGTIQKTPTAAAQYGFWQGYTTSTVSTGQYGGTSTVFTNYLAFIFASGVASNTFQQYAQAAADKHSYTMGQRIKGFFVRNEERPTLVTTASDGSFIIEYITVPDVPHYSARLNWVREHFGKMYYEKEINN